MSISFSRASQLALLASGWLVAGVAIQKPEPAVAQDREFQGWSQHETRGSTRLIYFHKTPQPKPWDSSPGEVAIEFGTPPWKDSYTAHFEQLVGADDPAKIPPEQRRWRMGMNHWTNLDTRFPLVMGGTEVPRGYYYPILDLDDDGQFGLRLLDPDQAIGGELDAWHINRKAIPDGLFVPLEHDESDTIQKQLDIKLVLDLEDQKKATLTIAFGPHRLSTEVLVKF